jgi:hypothetical protein
VRRSPAFNSPNQASIAFLPRCLIAGMLASPMRRWHWDFTMATHAPAAGPPNSVSRRRAP